MSTGVKERYLAELDQLLKKVPYQQRMDWLVDYESHFTIASQQGISEADTARELGDPRAIAQDLLQGYHIERAVEKPYPGNVTRAVFASIGMSFFNIVFVVGPYLAAMGILLAAWAVAASLPIAGIAIVLESIIYSSITYTFAISVAAILVGLGLLLGVCLNKLTRYTFTQTIRYIHFNKRVMGGTKA